MRKFFGPRHMINDFIESVGRWRLVHLLGISTLRARYARSKLGQFWLSVSTLLLILSTGIVWSLIWNMPIDEYLPYVGVGHVVYIFVSTTISESSTVLVGDSRIYLNDRMPFLISVFAHIYRNVIILLHNVPTVVILILWSHNAHLDLSPMYIVAILLTVLFLFFMSYALALLCARYRDILQLVAVIMQVIFLLTPIMWKVNMLPVDYRPYIYINPFAALVEILRNPLIGISVDPIAYCSLVLWIIPTAIWATWLHSKYGRTVIYWL